MQNIFPVATGKRSKAQLYYRGPNYTIFYQKKFSTLHKKLEALGQCLQEKNPSCNKKYYMGRAIVCQKIRIIQPIILCNQFHYGCDFSHIAVTKSKLSFSSIREGVPCGFGGWYLRSFYSLKAFLFQLCFFSHSPSCRKFHLYNEKQEI